MELNDKRLNVWYSGLDAVGNYKFFDNVTSEYLVIEKHLLLGESILIYGQSYSLRKSGNSYLVEGCAC